MEQERLLARFIGEITTASVNDDPVISSIMDDQLPSYSSSLLHNKVSHEEESSDASSKIYNVF